MNLLAFKLRQSVILLEREDLLQLILKYPLKIINLNPIWKPIFVLLKNDTYVPMEKIWETTSDIDIKKIEFFLNTLVCKGFVERVGFSEPEVFPLVSVIIPVRNRPQKIKACIESLMKLDYPSDKLEIIIVDDASTDQTVSVINCFPVKLIPLNKNKQASYCRNLAARTAKGEILAFIDSDCLASPLWLKELLSAFHEPTLGAVGGIIDSCFSENGLDQYEKVKSSLFLGKQFKNSNPADRFFYVPSCNLLVRKNLFLQLNGFNESLVVGEDVDFCWRMQDARHRLEYRPLGKVYHKHRNSLKPFCSRRFDYGTSEPLLQYHHHDRIKTSVFPPGATLFWAIFILATMFAQFLLIPLSLIPLFVDIAVIQVKIRQVKFPFKFLRLTSSIFRSYLGFFYHNCRFISRYHLIWLLPTIIFAPLVSAFIVVAHLLSATIEYYLKKPDLNPLVFLLFFSLEQVSYQLGVWKGCFQTGHFSPVFPRLAIRNSVYDSKYKK